MSTPGIWGVLEGKGADALLWGGALAAQMVYTIYGMASMHSSASVISNGDRLCVRFSRERELLCVRDWQVTVHS